MGELSKDTAVTSHPDHGGGTVQDGLGSRRVTAKLSEDWKIWGPNGGYVASVALRAAGLVTGRERPASLVGHFLGVAAFDEVEMDVHVLRRSRFATSVRVEMRQGDKPILEALVWGVDEGGAQLVHEVPTMPRVPPPSEMPSLDEHEAELEEEEDRSSFQINFWGNIESRPLDWSDSWPPDGPLEPVAQWWLRYRPTARFDDPWVDACRLLIPIDTMGWPAAHRPHVHLDPVIVAPTVDVSVRFHQPAADEEWLFCEATAPTASGGVMSATGRVWSQDGTLLASGGQSMLCIPAPGSPGSPG